MSDRTAVATAPQAISLEDIAQTLATDLVARGNVQLRTSLNGRIEASAVMEFIGDTDPVLVEKRVKEIITALYPPHKYEVTVRYFDTRGLYDNPRFIAGAYRMFFWATRVE